MRFSHNMSLYAESSDFKSGCVLSGIILIWLILDKVLQAKLIVSLCAIMKSAPKIGIETFAKIKCHRYFSPFNDMLTSFVPYIFRGAPFAVMTDGPVYGLSFDVVLSIGMKDLQAPVSMRNCLPETSSFI